MMKRFALLFIAVLLLSSCGLFKKSSPSGIVYDSSVSNEYQSLLERDFELVGGLTLQNVTRDDLDRIDLPQITGGDLSVFLRRRVRYIVGETFETDSQTLTLADNFRYSPFLFTASGFDASRIVTVMSNSGSAVYRAGKQANTLYALKIANQELTVNTPRVGVIKIGEGLFSNSRTSGFGADSLASRLLRLGTLFHESRHSDGNGDNAGFPHTKCPSGEFQDRYACESNTNGPYNLEAMLLKHFYRNCINCSETELSAIQISAADAASRLLPNAVKRNSSPEFVK